LSSRGQTIKSDIKVILPSSSHLTAYIDLSKLGIKDSFRPVQGFKKIKSSICFNPRDSHFAGSTLTVPNVDDVSYLSKSRLFFPSDSRSNLTSGQRPSEIDSISSSNNILISLDSDSDVNSNLESPTRNRLSQAPQKNFNSNLSLLSMMSADFPNNNKSDAGDSVSSGTHFDSTTRQLTLDMT